MNIRHIDHAIIRGLRSAFIPCARWAIFVVFVWFGALKLLGLSPATGLVHALFDRTIHGIPFETFFVAFAAFEVLIGILFVIPRATRVVMPLLLLHMVTTFLPLVLLPGETWNGFLALTIEGQYIVKNLVIVALAIGIAAHSDPLPHIPKASPGN